MNEFCKQTNVFVLTHCAGIRVICSYNFLPVT